MDFQKKLQEEKDSVAKEIENKLQQQIREKDLAKSSLENQLRQKLSEEVATKKQLECETAPVIDDSRVKHLEAQNEQLQGLVDKYKKIIDDTVSLLTLICASRKLCNFLLFNTQNLVCQTIL